MQAWFSTASTRWAHGLVAAFSAVLAISALSAFAMMPALAQAPELQAPPPLPKPQLPWPAPRLWAPEARLPVQLARLNVQVEATGSLASTRIEITVHNPNERVLEATLEFPLEETQTVSGFALDIQGELVAAVPVPKDKGRQVFDDVTRQRVDPALLERTAGNSFKLRIYPIPAGGSRRVVLQLSEVLRTGPQGRLQYRLPLNFGQRIGEFSAAFSVQGGTGLQGLGALQGSAVATAAEQGSLQLQQRDWWPREPLVLQWRAAASESTVFGRHDGRTHFYAELPLQATPGAALLPRELRLVWDASGSGALRDHSREFALLDALFAAARTLRVQLVLARDVAEPVQHFQVSQGDWRALRRVLENVPYDGASSEAAWAPPPPASAAGESLALLFGDGLANWPAAAPLPAPARRLFTLNAAQRADANRLRRLAEQGGGRYIDLNRIDTAAALDQLLRPALQVVDVAASGAEQVVLSSAHAEGGRLALAGWLNAPTARITLSLADGRGRQQTRVLDLAPSASSRLATAGGETLALAAQRWAQLRVAQLEGERQRHRAEIRRLGELYRLVSAETSLIVLEALADYQRYEIVPPAGAMRAQYLEQEARRSRQRQQSNSAHLDQLVRRFEERQRWWARDFPKDTPPPTKPWAMVPGSQEGPRGFAPAMSALTAIQAPAAAQAQRAEASAMVADAGSAQRERRPASAGADKVAEPGTPAARIQLRRWEPDAAYARRLRDAADPDRYAIYLDERAGQTGSTAFFIDAAEIFFRRGQQALALRVLSNLAEMELENRHVLRLLAYRLQQADVPATAQALAPALLERVRELAPDEPQSWRDLGLALAATQPQRALQMLWAVASRPWDPRFSDIDLIALGELNTLVAARAAVGEALDTRDIDPRLLRHLPLDLRAVLTWDADNTDIDLWVIDPNGEKTFYGRRLSTQGGAMTRDFTGGYGPEEFSLRHAKPGRYEVRAEFYGHRQQIVSPYTTLMLWLSTGWGTPAQKDERVVLRLSGRQEQVLVGSFEVGALATTAPTR